MSEILLKDGIRYLLYNYDTEDEFVKIIFQHYEDVFGKNSIILPSQKIKTPSGIGTLPDAFLLPIEEQKWYVIEVELESHPLYQHVVAQISKFNTAIRNVASRKELIDAFYHAIENDPLKSVIFQIKGVREIYKFISETLELDPEIIIFIDNENAELNEICSSLPFPSKVRVFKTYCREGVGLGDHIHKFEPLIRMKIDEIVEPAPPSPSPAPPVRRRFKINSHTLKVEKENAKAMIEGFKKNNEHYYVTIYTASKGATSLKENFREVPKILTTTRRTKYRLSDIGKGLNIERYIHKAKYVAVLDTIFHIRNNIIIWDKLCNNGVFDIWDPTEPYKSLKKKDNPLKDKHDPMILLLRIFEVDHDFTSEIDEKIYSDKIKDTAIKEVEIIRPIVNNNDFAGIKNKIKDAIRGNIRDEVRVCDTSQIQ